MKKEDSSSTGALIRRGSTSGEIWDRSPRPKPRGHLALGRQVFRLRASGPHTFPRHPLQATQWQMRRAVGSSRAIDGRNTQPAPRISLDLSVPTNHPSRRRVHGGIGLYEEIKPAPHFPFHSHDQIHASTCRTSTIISNSRAAYKRYFPRLLRRSIR